jgi:hydrogenase maturation protease
MGDDAIGLIAARECRRLFPTPPYQIEIAEAMAGGFALLDLLEGFTHALILDAVSTGSHAPGTVLLLSPDVFGGPVTSTPHTVGLPEIMETARRLAIPFPAEVRILGVEILPVEQLNIGLSEPVRNALPLLLDRARSIVESWLPALH